MRIVLMGPPGAGKGTHGRALTECAGIPAVSTGQMFRDTVAGDSELSRTIKTLIDNGEFVPDELTNRMLKERLQRPDVAQGFILDGYPRNLGQARYLEELLQELNAPLDTVLYLDVPEEVTIERLLERATIENRADDTEPVIRHRMEVYREQTAPVLNFYEERGLLVKVDGVGGIDEVDDRVCKALSVGR